MASTRPNVIILITDDQGYGDMACHGNPVALTPHMDALHDDSVRFADFHAAPMCTPTRGQLLSGLDAPRNGAVNVSSGRTMLRADLDTMADVFGRSGYRTGVFGKWHLGDNYPYRPQDRGFEDSLWFPSSHISSLPDYWENDYFDDVYCRNGTRVRQEGYCTEVFFTEAMSWIESRVDADEPFFLYLPTNAPHAPHFVPRADREAVEQWFSENESKLGEYASERREGIIRFLAMIRNVDTQLGRLREFLREKKIDGDTILMFMTDNGSTFGPSYYNAGMKGAKCSLWEGGHRVPCFLSWPGGDIGAPREIDGLTQVQDILPTLVDFCGLDAPRNGILDGISLADAMRGKATVPEDRMIAINYSRMPKFDYPTPDAESVMRREGAAVMWKRWRLLEGTALYDLDADPMQERNVFAGNPDVVERMTAYLDSWWAEVEPVANQVLRVTIGNDNENPMMLTACGWRDVFDDQQRQVRYGERKNGYWHLSVDRPGTYEFELRRWPRESGLKLTDACAATEVADGMYEEGVAMPIAHARMMVDRKQMRRQVAAGDEAATFTVDLEAKDVLLHTWFLDEKHQPICGAYYVYVNRTDQH